MTMTNEELDALVAQAAGYKAVLASHPDIVDQEPVAWLHRWHNGNPAGIYEFKANAPPGVVVTPLYTAHQPITVQDAARVPEIAALIEAGKAATLFLAEHEPYPLTACQALAAALRAIAEGK